LALGLLEDVLFIGALTLLVAAVAAPDWRKVRTSIPVLVGVFAAYLAGTAWDFVLIHARYQNGGTPTNCGAIDQQYFAQMAQVIPVLLIALGVERRFFAALLGNKISRAMTVLTITILSVAETLAALVRPNKCNEALLNEWHEFATFELTIAAVVVGLATLVWSIFVEVNDISSSPGGSTR
jgi:hypothetical protein